MLQKHATPVVPIYLSIKEENHKVFGHQSHLIATIKEVPVLTKHRHDCNQKSGTANEFLLSPMIYNILPVEHRNKQDAQDAQDAQDQNTQTK